MLAALALVALLLHMGVLDGLQSQVGAAAVPGRGAAPLQVRVIEVTERPSAAAAVPPPVRAMAGPPSAPERRPRARPPAPASAERKARVAVAAEAAPARAEPDPAPTSAGDAVADATAAAQPPAAPTAVPPAGPDASPAALPIMAAPSPGDRELPVYRTVIPPPLTVRYQLRRGALQGSGELQWRPEGDRYEARLTGQVAGVSVLTQVSQGGFDEAGVAPLRFTDQRLRGGVRAANFQREVGKITFSGPAVEYPLLVGSQDRLSWMIQLAAVLTAEPQRLQDGGKVVIHVVGARGDSAVWVFRFVGLESVRAGSGPTLAAHFVREPGLVGDARDTRVDVWLDPQRHHLPVRAVQRNGPDDDGLELLLLDEIAVP